MSNSRRTITLWVLVALVAAAGFAASTVNVSPANAAAVLMATVGMKSNAPKPTCPAPFVFSGKKASCVPCPQGSQFDKASSSCKAAPGAVQKCTTTTDANGVKTTICVTGTQATVAGKTASASALVSGSVTILADSTVKGGVKVVQIHSSGCHFVRNFKNSGKDAKGHLHFFVDHNGTLCPSKASPTGWVKVSGGMTGRHCMNPAAEMNSKFKVIKGTVLLVKSLHIVIPVRGSVSVYVQDTCGHAAASSLASATITLTAYARSKGNVSINTFGKTVLSLKTSVKASITCGPTQTVTTGTTTNVTTTNVTTTNVTTTTQTTPSKPTFTMSFDTINDIPAGTCRPEALHVTSSVAGQVQVSPNVGLVSTIDCKQPDTGQLSKVTLQVDTGSHDLTVYVYEPTDTSATSDTLTAVPLIKDVDAKSNTATTSFTVSHPTRP